MREFGFTLLITCIDGLIDLYFKFKRGDMTVGKLKKDFKEQMEESRDANYEKLKLVLPGKGTESEVKRRKGVNDNGDVNS